EDFLNAFFQNILKRRVAKNLLDVCGYDCYSSHDKLQEFCRLDNYARKNRPVYVWNFLARGGPRLRHRSRIAVL
ncbi:MAG: hypothetical protein ACK52S_01935, partial [Pirellula sp.]